MHLGGRFESGIRFSIEGGALLFPAGRTASDGADGRAQQPQDEVEVGEARGGAHARPAMRQIHAAQQTGRNRPQRHDQPLPHKHDQQPHAAGHGQQHFDGE